MSNWKNEPNEVDWASEAGFPCSIRRVDWSGHLCGYVAVPAGHPWHGKNYMEIDADVHGGLTFSASGHEIDADGRRFIAADPDAWVAGFDCAHSGDLCPKTAEDHPALYAGRTWETYRDIAYVRGEVESLARQAATALLDALDEQRSKAS